MKQTIKHIVYDTRKAKLAAQSSAEFHPDPDFLWSEKLYVTAKGRWFLHAQGGAMTKYAIQKYTHLIGGEVILPLTTVEALDWCERNGAQRAIEIYLKDLIEEA
jgi:hypothetical protein